MNEKIICYTMCQIRSALSWDTKVSLANYLQRLYYFTRIFNEDCLALVERLNSIHLINILVCKNGAAC